MVYPKWGRCNEVQQVSNSGLDIDRHIVLDAGAGTGKLR